MTGPPSGCSTGGSGSGQGSCGFFGSLWSCICRFSFQSENTVRNPKYVEITVENLDPINSKRVTVEMCRESYDRQPNLYQEEIFKPRETDPESLPSTETFEDGEQPVDHENSGGSIEAVSEAMDVVKDDVDEYREAGHDGE